MVVLQDQRTSCCGSAAHGEHILNPDRHTSQRAELPARLDGGIDLLRLFKRAFTAQRQETVDFGITRCNALVVLLG